jgi:hypothetical protein
MRMKRFGNAVLLCAYVVFHAHVLFAEDRDASKFLVINSPSDASAGVDSILTFDSQGNSNVFFGVSNNLEGLRDIACEPPPKPRHDERQLVVVSHVNFAQNISELLDFNPSGELVKTTPFGTPGAELSLAFDRHGNFYAAQDTDVFKNGKLFSTVPSGGLGRIAVDSRGNLYITSPFLAPQVLRIDPLGNVTVFADASEGLASPYGLAIDGRDNIYVANNPPSAPAFILKFDQSGNVSTFATGISFQPIIRSMTFDRQNNLYATLEEPNEILKFDTKGNSTVFADANHGLNHPGAIKSCPGEEEEREKDESR